MRVIFAVHGIRGAKKERLDIIVRRVIKGRCAN